MWELVLLLIIQLLFLPFIAIVCKSKNRVRRTLKLRAQPKGARARNHGGGKPKGRSNDKASTREQASSKSEIILVSPMNLQNLRKEDTFVMKTAYSEGDSTEDTIMKQPLKGSNVEDEARVESQVKGDSEHPEDFTACGASDADDRNKQSPARRDLNQLSPGARTEKNALLDPAARDEFCKHQNENESSGKHTPKFRKKDPLTQSPGVSDPTNVDHSSGKTAGQMVTATGTTAQTLTANGVTGATTSTHWDEINAEESNLSVAVQPTVLVWSANGGTLQLTLSNTTDQRRAFKVNASNSSVYRVNPVVGFLERCGTVHVEVMRLSGIAADAEHIVIVTTTASADEANAAASFKNNLPLKKSSIPCRTE